MARALVAPLLLVVALLAPAGAEAAYRDFRSPTGRLGCAFYSDAQTPRQVRCDWAGSNDTTMLLKQRGKGRRVRATDTVRNPKARVLAYGRSTKFGRLRCKSRRSGITCKSLRSGHGFTVSVEKQRVF
ncbi:MAG TPA: DUF6636 domain-containing protein [Solirubrobacter sp.]|nr:DUF6636 domain-containing protein [Solirubrobacter sp.]